MKVKTFCGEYDVTMQKTQYSNNGNLAIELIDKEDGCPFATLTVNLNKLPNNNLAYVDTNNCPWGEKFIKENGLGEPTGKYGYSGYCSYPLYKFN